MNEKTGTIVTQEPDSQTIGCLRVSSRSSPASVAGAIAGMIKDGSPVEIQAVGAGAVNQAVKAIAISRGFLSPIGIEIVCVPSFADIVIDGDYRTGHRASRWVLRSEARGSVTMAAQNLSQTTYCVVTYGCQMNAHDSEKLAGMLQ